ncbi:shikimate kinase [Xylocopilactobacillus apicola]|uniref:Shikimate kinase n=1 Tax=Xylocopilactobacillus apicola TaxID=2932184 RepID=A0AAU9CYV2_9LACO|nr:shikimate kinase [Xylocopilactobacillus apicola]BDR59189.1 shikimate kinase [Xylocopilactobacillus apicola]
MQAILIGFMGSGKTTVGRLLAEQLKTKHIDLDNLIVEEAGQSISEIFAKHGEAHFRKLEQQILSKALKLPGILSTGGGTPTIPANVSLLLSSKAPIIWLAASNQATINHLKNDTSRPLIKDLNQDGLLKLKEKRFSQYEKIADLTIKTDSLTPLQIMQQIKEWLLRKDR